MMVSLYLINFDFNYLGIADFNSIFLQEIPKLFRKGAIKLNVTFIHVSPPDEHGFCSLGVSVDGTRAAMNCSDYVIGKLNSILIIFIFLILKSCSLIKLLTVTKNFIFKIWLNGTD